MKKNRRRRSRSRRRGLKIAIVIFSIPCLILLGALVHYYYVFNQLIEEKLKMHPSFHSTEIYSAPLKLYPGKAVPMDSLVSTVKRLGYVGRVPANASVTSNYRIRKDTHLYVYNDGSVPLSGNRSVEIIGSTEGIVSITDVSTKESLPVFYLKPALLSNAIDQSREKRRIVRYRNLPEVLINAVLASEDHRFFRHSGIDPIRIFKAAYVDIQQRDLAQGASTLTQQFVKNYFLTPEKAWRRKLTDAFMAVLLEQRLSKEQILELYCNEAYLGQSGSFAIIGFGEAANAFFDKNVKDLNLGEAATLAGIISAPNRYNPVRHPSRAKARRDLVLGIMEGYGMISQEEFQETLLLPLEVTPTSNFNFSNAPYFVDYVQDILEERLGGSALTGSKYKVYTSLNMELQQAAFESIKQGVSELDEKLASEKRAIAKGTVQASLIALDPRTGHVVAMVGGRNYADSQYNRITQSQRQPGSIFKPFVYAAALETAYTRSAPLTAVSTVLDQRTSFSFSDLMYEPKNFKNQYHGQLTMRQAITKSANVSTIKFAEQIGYEKVSDMANRLQVKEEIEPYPAMAIGAFEVTPLVMVRAYTAFANQGQLVELTPITRVLDRGRDIIWEPTYEIQQALTPQVAYMITSLLKSVISRGTGAGVRARGFDLPAAGKTGTSHDGWFAGYTSDLLCIVWVGFDDNRELNLSGSQAALPIWTEFMKRARNLYPLSGDQFEVPEGVVQLEIDPSTGLLATERCLDRVQEYFIEGTEPAISCYGNSYEQMFTGPSSIYQTAPKDSFLDADNEENAIGGARTRPSSLRQ